MYYEVEVLINNQRETVTVSAESEKEAMELARRKIKTNYKYQILSVRRR